MKQTNSPDASPPACDHAHPPGSGELARPEADAAALDRAARLFRAMGDAHRMRLLVLLLPGECCVTELVETVGEKFSTVSQRLRVLRTERLVNSRRVGLHVFYTLADQHVADLVANAVAHAGHLSPVPNRSPVMAHTHENHAHVHGPACGHTAVTHGDHVDYLHDGHLHHVAGGAVEEHTLDVTATNPATCTPDHACAAHDKAHVHGDGCGHEAVPHGDHVDYLVAGHLHHPHGDHCDDHGPVAVVAAG